MELNKLLALISSSTSVLIVWKHNHSFAECDLISNKSNINQKQTGREQPLLSFNLYNVTIASMNVKYAFKFTLIFFRLLSNCLNWKILLR